MEKNLALTDDFKKQVDLYWKRRKERLDHRKEIRPPKKALVSVLDCEAAQQSLLSVLHYHNVVSYKFISNQFTAEEAFGEAA